MHITAMALCQAVAPTAQAPTVSAAVRGFAALLGEIQSGAPPGAAPPTTGAKVEEEVANLGQTALSLNPDFLPAAEESTQKNSAHTVEVDPVIAMMSLTASIGAMQTAMPMLVQRAFAAVEKPGIIQPIVPTPAEPTVAPAAKTPEFSLLPDGTIDPASISESPAPPAEASPAVAWIPMGMPAEDTKDVDLRRGKSESTADAPKAAPAVQVGTQPKPGLGSTTQLLAEAAPELKATAAATNVAPKAAPADEPKAYDAKAKSLESKSVSMSPKTADGPKVESKAGVIEVDDREIEKPTKVAGGIAEPAVESAPIQIARMETVATKQALPRRDVSLVIRQVADRIELMAATRPRNGVTIQLQPEHLGTITMTVKTVAGSIDAHIAASNESVRTALEQNRGMLSQSLEQRGLKLENVSVASQTNTSTFQRNAQQQQQQHQAQDRSHQQGITADREVRVGAISHQRPMSRSVDGVDLWI